VHKATTEASRALARGNHVEKLLLKGFGKPVLGKVLERIRESGASARLDVLPLADKLKQLRWEQSGV
jgi:hypothetical protein